MTVGRIECYTNAMKTTMYFIRHGQTDWNNERRLQGQTDIPLNSEGLTQAHTAAGLLSDVSFKAIYSSPLTRALTTAQIIASHQGLPVQAVQAFRECNFGIFEGFRWGEIDAHPQFDALEKARNPLGYRVPGGESIQDLYDRVIPALNTIINVHPDETVAIVSHGVVMRAFLHHVHRVPHDESKRVEIQNARPYTVHYDHDRAEFDIIDFPIVYIA